MKDTRVFVTGGAGVIGVELVPRLVARGAKVLVGDLKPRPSTFPATVHYRQGDLNEMLSPELKAFDPHVIIHLAATFERTTETPGFWQENFHNNVMLSHRIMTIASECPGLRRAIFASSYLVYEPSLYQFNAPPERPTRLVESDPIRPRNLTGMAKLSHEMELQFLSGFDSCQFSTLSVRIFRGYGKDSRDVISRWIRTLLMDGPICVYRQEGAFDYIYAADSAEGLVRLTEAEDVTGVINLGTGCARRVEDVVRVLKEQFPRARIERAESDIPIEASEADTSRLRTLLDWEPQYRLEDAIPEIIAHEKARSPVGEAPTRELPNVLVTSASRKAPLIREARNALARINPEARIVAGDCNTDAPVRYLVDEFWTMPETIDASVDVIIEGCRSRNVGLVLPTRDGELPFWSRHRSTFSRAGINIVISSLESVNRCIDKLAFARFGKMAGFPVIPAVDEIDELDEGPYVVKERYGSGSERIGLELSREAAITHATKLRSAIYQPHVDGIEFSIDSWLDATGHAPGVVMRRRDLVIGGESQVTTMVRFTEIENEARKILENLHLQGPVVMQVIVNTEGMHIIEVNPRFGGASTLAIAAGMDSIYWSFAEAFGISIEPTFTPKDTELRQVRLPTDIIVHDHHI